LKKSNVECRLPDKRNASRCNIRRAPHGYPPSGGGGGLPPLGRPWKPIEKLSRRNFINSFDVSEIPG